MFHRLFCLLCLFVIIYLILIVNSNSEIYIEDLLLFFNSVPGIYKISRVRINQQS